MAINEKTRVRIEKAVRLEFMNLGLTNDEIARYLGMSPGAYNMLKQHQAYKDIRTRIMSGIVGKMDVQVEEDIKSMKGDFKRMIPVALQNLMDMALGNTVATAGLTKEQMRMKAFATKEILDRSGHFSKVSRVGLPTEEQGGKSTPVDDAVASKLRQVLHEAETERAALLAKDAEKTIDGIPITDKVQ